MTAAPLPASAAATADGVGTGFPISSVVTRNTPVIVLTFAHSGVEHLRSLLSAIPDLACTSGTGVIPMCEYAAFTWQQAEARADDALSPLAAASIRSMASSVITVMLARAGRRRWCEFALAAPSSAETFLRLYPETQFLCLHRACPDVIYAALQASPWGLAGAVFAPFTAAFPASSVEALAAYWATRAGQLIAFEESHRDRCYRVRYEDLVAGPQDAASGIFGFLAEEQYGSEPPWASAGALAARAALPGCGAQLPVEQIPAPLLDQVDDLMIKLGYLPLAQNP